MTSGILGGVIGLLVGLLYCYWKSINSAYQNRNLISSGANLAGAAGDFVDQLRGGTKL